MKTHGARTGWQTLASTSWLLLLAGLSCKYNVTLPWVPEDASARVTDTALDGSPSSPDTPPPSSDTRGACPGNLQEFGAHTNPPQMIVAIDRSTNMQKGFDSATISKTRAAWEALTSAIEQNPKISFVPIWFPWPNCGAVACCSSPLATGRGGGNPDASSGCAPYEAGCLQVSNDSPSYSALQKANTATRYGLTTTVVLITNQDPSCTGEPDSNAWDATSTMLSTLNFQQNRTFVLVPNTDGQIPDCFSRIARQQNPRDYFTTQVVPARTSDELISKLKEIAVESNTALCRFYIRDVTNLNDVEQVKIGGSPVPRDGWQIDHGAIVLTDEYCKTTTSGNQQVKARVCNNGPGWP